MVVSPPADLGPLFERAPVEPEPPKSIDQSFLEFHRANPGVYEELRRLARDVLARGHTRVSIDALYHRVRWDRVFERTYDPNSTFHLNDRYTSRYARLLMQREPELAGLFETRRLRA